MAITDSNFVCSRVLPAHFPAIFGKCKNKPLDDVASIRSMEDLRLQHKEELGPEVDKEVVLAYSFLCMANKTVCQPICALTRHWGHELSAHVLACFGGAKQQHACAVAGTLGMRTMFVHRHGSVLRAYCIDIADTVEERQSLAANVWNGNKDAKRETRFTPLVKEATKAHQLRLSQGQRASGALPPPALQGYVQRRHGAREQRRLHLLRELCGALQS